MAGTFYIPRFNLVQHHFEISYKITLLVPHTCCICYTIVVYCVSGDLVQDDWSSLKEVSLKDMASDEQYDSDTVYGE